MKEVREKEKRFILIGPLPPPHNGQSIAFQMVSEGFKKHQIPFELINLAGKETIGGSQFSWVRLWEHIGFMVQFLFKASFGEKTIYLIAGQYLPGFLRDMLIISYAKLFGHRVVCHLHGGIYNHFYHSQTPFVQRLIRNTWLKVDTIVVLGEGLRQLFDFEIKLREKISVVPNGFSPEESIHLKYKALPRNHSEPIKILFLSNLIESKGYFDLLKGVYILVKQYGFNVECNFCGVFLKHRSDDLTVKSSTQAKALFEQFIRNHQLQKFIHYRGVVTGKEKEEILLNSHFLVLPTYYDVEGQPISIIEAMAFGNIVVATNYRAVSDLVIEGKTGFFVPPQSPESIALVIAEVAKDREKFETMSRETIAFYKDNFTVEHHIDRLFSILKCQRTTGSQADPPKEMDLTEMSGGKNTGWREKTKKRGRPPLIPIELKKNLCPERSPRVNRPNEILHRNDPYDR